MAQASSIPREGFGMDPMAGGKAPPMERYSADSDCKLEPWQGGFRFPNLALVVFCCCLESLSTLLTRAAFSGCTEP